MSRENTSLPLTRHGLPYSHLSPMRRELEPRSHQYNDGRIEGVGQPMVYVRTTDGTFYRQCPICDGAGCLSCNKEGYSLVGEGGSAGTVT